MAGAVGTAGHSAHTIAHDTHSCTHSEKREGWHPTPPPPRPSRVPIPIPGSRRGGYNLFGTLLYMYIYTKIFIRTRSGGDMEIIGLLAMDAQHIMINK